MCIYGFGFMQCDWQTELKVASVLKNVLRIWSHLLIYASQFVLPVYVIITAMHKYAVIKLTAAYMLFLIQTFLHV